MAVSRGADVSLAGRESRRRAIFRFDPRLKLMTTVDEQDGVPVISVKGAPEEVMKRVTRIMGPTGERPATDADRGRVTEVMASYGRQGLRVLAFARRVLAARGADPSDTWPAGRRSGPCRGPLRRRAGRRFHRE